MKLLQAKLAQYQEPQKAKALGIYPYFREIESEQDTEVYMHGKKVLMFGSNCYTGLVNDKRVHEAAIKAIQKYGTGCAGSPFLNGTLDIHKKLERRLADFVGKEDAMVYSTGFGVNLGVVSTLTGRGDYIICDEQDHASIIEGRRLSFSNYLKYKHNDMASLEEQLKKCEPDRVKLIVTDGVFSMDGIIANLKGVCDLAEKYGALVVVDDSHATGFVGDTGRGTAEYCGVQGRVDIITGTFGKALGGASGGFTSGRREIIDLLRQRSRPYLFSNTVAPAICATTLKVLEMLTNDTSLRDKVMENAKYFRAEMEKAGFDLAGKDHAIVPVMLYDAVLSQKVAQRMLEKGIYVTGFFYPVVPKEKARIRTQMSAAHSKEDIDKCVKAFVECKEEFGF